MDKKYLTIEDLEYLYPPARYFTRANKKIEIIKYGYLIEWEYLDQEKMNFTSPVSFQDYPVSFQDYYFPLKKINKKFVMKAPTKFDSMDNLYQLFLRFGNKLIDVC
jgi:hypothetical protein